METIERQIRKRLQMGWKVLSSFSMASSCGSVSQRTLAALDIYSLPSSTWFQTPSEFKKTHIQLVPQMGTCMCGGGGGETALGFSGGHGGLERGYGRKMLAGPIANVFATGPHIVWLEA